MEAANNVREKKKWLGLIQAVQIGVDSGVIDSQELVGRGHHVNFIGLPLSTFTVHELKHGLVLGSVLKVNRHDEKQRSAQWRLNN